MKNYIDVCRFYELSFPSGFSTVEACSSERVYSTAIVSPNKLI